MISATQAPSSRGSPSWVSAGTQASSPSARIAVRTGSVRSKPTEKRSRPSRQKSITSCVAPALSARTRIASRAATFLGSCASAASSDRDLVGGGVGAGVAGPQQAGERLLGAVEVGEHRVKPEAALEVARPRRPCRSARSAAWRRDRSPISRGRAPRPPRPRTWPPRAPRRSAPARPDRRRSAAISRYAVESDATGPNSACWSRTAARSHSASPPSASITARSRITRPGRVTRRALAQRRQRAIERAREPQPIGASRRSARRRSATPAPLRPPSPLPSHRAHRASPAR